ncbi:uncharacterized protein P884DRAFT_261508 [Thermothelomyces heterothallicus CBS 202.75]|uniref:uncharacterized protein n=1 Tax=Thermothelomyces heterothallicus CBS 202.75 TaxID=1149848 RepID=UPI003743C31E
MVGLGPKPPPSRKGTGKCNLELLRSSLLPDHPALWCCDTQVPFFDLWSGVVGGRQIVLRVPPLWERLFFFPFHPRVVWHARREQAKHGKPGFTAAFKRSRYGSDL